MSTYSKLKREFVDTCRGWLVEMVKDIELNHFVRKYFFILLYEYCACYAYLLFNNGNEYDDVNITLKYMKEYCVSYMPQETAQKVCKGLLSIRNSFAHITPELFSEKRVYDFLALDEALTLLTLFNVPDSVVNALRIYKNKHDFNPWDYIRQKVGDYANLLPVAAVDNCKSEEECQDLIDSLQSLF